ncbi:hypothetical protein [Halorhodospira abdelmalekii]|uniref:hypothetical protein n=1 Tax=Halorhodospira abdelmalekii TaxID=421629 RepID=UPI0019087274|nr:hypothetical protein [Halorhodospira abdelmalekii]
MSDTDQSAPQTMGEAFDLLCAEGIIDAELGDRMRAAGRGIFAEFCNMPSKSTT